MMSCCRRLSDRSVGKSSQEIVFQLNFYVVFVDENDEKTMKLKLTQKTVEFPVESWSCANDIPRIRNVVDHFNLEKKISSIWLDSLIHISPSNLIFYHSHSRFYFFHFFLLFLHLLETIYTFHSRIRVKKSTKKVPWLEQTMVSERRLNSKDACTIFMLLSFRQKAILLRLSRSAHSQ